MAQVFFCTKKVLEKNGIKIYLDVILTMQEWCSLIVQLYCSLNVFVFLYSLKTIVPQSQQCNSLMMIQRCLLETQEVLKSHITYFSLFSSEKKGTKRKEKSSNNLFNLKELPSLSYWRKKRSEFDLKHCRKRGKKGICWTFVFLFVCWAHRKLFIVNFCQVQTNIFWKCCIW